MRYYSNIALSAQTTNFTLQLLCQMRPVFVIGICFFIVIMFPFIPTRVETDRGVLIQEGVYPAPVSFSLVCVAVAIISLGLSYRRFAQPLKGELLLKRIDLNLRYLVPFLFVWISFILLAHYLLALLVPSFHQLTPYFIIILICFLLYEFIWKGIVSMIRPDFVSYHSEALHIRNFYGDEKRDLKDLKSVDFNSAKNCVELHFYDGLDSKKFFLNDYEKEQLQNLVAFLQRVGAKSIDIDPALESKLQPD